MIKNIQYHPFYTIALVFLIFMAGSFTFCYGFLSGSMSSDKISEKGNPYVKEMIFKDDQQKAIYQRQWFPTQAKQTIFMFEDSLAFYLAVDEYMQQQYKLDSKGDQIENKNTNKTNKYSESVLFKEMLNRVITEPSNSLLFKSFAHPPTYTEIRVQAVLQGNLPTYLSFKSNMGSKKIRQDNIIYQAKYNNPFLGIDESRTKILFYGDLIWKNLVGDLFDRSRYIEEASFEERKKQDFKMYESIEAEQMRNNDWSTLFVHLNGIDDASHASNSMEDQNFINTLQVESDLLGKILNNTNQSTVNNDQAIIIVSDHGLDYNAYAHHGGQTPNETNSLVFGYSKKGFIQKEYKDIGQMMDREYLSNPAIFSIHATPTFCMIQGVPIPSNNLGMIIPDFFINSPDVDDFVIANNYYTNFRQVEDRFLEACDEATGGMDEAENINLLASEIKDQYKKLFVNLNSTGMIQTNDLKKFVESCFQFSVKVVETIQKEVKDPKFLFMYQGLIIHFLATVLANIFLIILQRASNRVQGMFDFILNFNVFIKKIRLVLIVALILDGSFYFVLRFKIFLSFQMILIVFVFSYSAYQSLSFFKGNQYDRIITQQHEPKNNSIIERIIYYMDFIFFLGSQIFFIVTRTSNDYYEISYDYYLGYLEYYCLFLLFYVVLRFKQLKQVQTTLLLISKIVAIPVLLYFIGLYCTRIPNKIKRINRETRQSVDDSYFFSKILPLCVFKIFFIFINYQILKSIRSKCSLRYNLFFLYQSIVQIGSVIVFYFCIFNKIYFNLVIKICPAISLFHLILGEIVKYIYLKKNNIHFSQNWKIFTSSMSFTLGLMYTLEANSLVQLPIFFVIIYLVCSVCISLKTVSQMNIFLFLFFISQHLFFAGGHVELFSELHIEVFEYMSIFKGSVIPIFNGFMNTYFYILITIVLLPIIISLSNFDSIDNNTPVCILYYILDINQETKTKLDTLNNVQKQTEKDQEIEIIQINQDYQSLIKQTEENKFNQTQQFLKYSFYCLIFISPIIAGFNSADIRNILKPLDSWKEQAYMPNYLFQLIFIILYFLTMLLGLCWTRTKN